MAGEHNKRWHDMVWSWLGSVCRRSPFLAKTFEISGHVASYVSWRELRGLDGARQYRTRERMWRATAGTRLQTGKVTVLEFGVAGGDATRIWLSMLPNPELRWHGFDTFTGLPQPWIRGGIRFKDVGDFSAGGQPPDVADSRVSWHAGLLQETLPVAPIDLAPPLCVLFDLDLYEPSAFALKWLAPHLKPGDLLYFDEAYDPWHERRALDEFLDRGHRVRALGATGTALVLEYEGGPSNT